MTTAWWMAQLALLGGLLALAAYGAESALTVARRPTRGVWLLALLLTIALGAAAPLRLARGTRITTIALEPAPAAGIATAVQDGGGMTWIRALWGTMLSRGEAQVQRAWEAWHGAMPAQVDDVLLVAWLVASMALLVVFVAVHARYRRRRAQWRHAEVRGTRVRVARDTGPAVIGVVQPEVVVPAWLLERDAREQELVLAHELEHVRVHDPVVLAVAQLAVVLLPWHPAVWWMASRLRLAVELDCDRRVLQRGASARDYGTVLIDLTDHRAQFGAAVPAFSCSPSHLERRLVAMTPKRLKYPLVRTITAGAFASLALLAACEAKLPTSEEVNAMTAKSATEAAAFVTKSDTANIRYFIDDVPATKADAEKLSAERIASVDVRKGAQGNEVRIVTVLRAAGYAKTSDSNAATGIVMLKKPGGTDVLLVTKSDSVTQGKSRFEMRVDTSRSRAAFVGLVVIDGIAHNASDMNTIPPDQIVSVNVIKGPAAIAKYPDQRAANGVIEIVTRKAASPK